MHREHIMKFKSRFLIAAITAALPSLASAQQRPAIRQLGPVVAKSTDALNSIIGIRALPNGNVLVNDVRGRRLVLLDGALATKVLVADSTAATATAYAGRTGGLIPFRADSSIFVDPQSMSMLIIDGSGKIARVMSVPRTQDVMMLAGPIATSVGFDPRGRLIYRAPPRSSGLGPQEDEAVVRAQAELAFTAPVFPDSLPIIRVDLATRQGGHHCIRKDSEGEDGRGDGRRADENDLADESTTDGR